jgi:hypothetical protein
MKYTKDFEKYWSNSPGANFHNLELWQWNEIKRVAFCAWKAGKRKVKEDFGLVQHQSIIKGNSYNDNL